MCFFRMVLKSAVNIVKFCLFREMLVGPMCRPYYIQQPKQQAGVVVAYVEFV